MASAAGDNGARTRTVRRRGQRPVGGVTPSDSASTEQLPDLSGIDVDLILRAADEILRARGREKPQPHARPATRASKFLAMNMGALLKRYREVGPQQMLNLSSPEKMKEISDKLTQLRMMCDEMLALYAAELERSSDAALPYLTRRRWGARCSYLGGAWAPHYAARPV